MELSNFIKDILLTRDNVIVPDFGGFEKTKVSAAIDETTGEMTPPHNTVVFRPELTSDSGVLIKHIAEKEKISEEAAKEEITKEVEAWNKSFETGKNVLLNGLGMLHKDVSGTISFTPSIKPSDFPDSFGLPIITLQEKSASVQQPITKKPEKEKVVKKEIPKKKVPVKKPVVQKIKKEPSGDNKISKKLIIGLAIGIPVAALIILGALNFDFVKQKFNDTSNFVSGLISGNNDKDTTTVVVENKDTLTAQDSADMETEAILQNYTIINAETNSKIEPKIEELKTVNKVHIIAGSYKRKDYAQRHRNKLNRKGFKAEVLPVNNGLFRVSVGSYDNIEAATNDFDRIKSIDESVNVWILVNK